MPSDSVVSTISCGGELHFDATLDDNVAPALVSECVLIYLSMAAAAASANFICMAIGWRR